MSDTRTVFVSLVVEPNGDGYLATVPGLQEPSLREIPWRRRCLTVLT